MSVVIRLKVPTEMHYTVIPMGTSKVNSSRSKYYKAMSVTGAIVQSNTRRCFGDPIDINKSAEQYTSADQYQNSTLMK